MSKRTPKRIGVVDKSAITLSLFDMHLTPFAFCRWAAMGKNPKLWGVAQQCLYKLLPTPPLSLWQVMSFFGLHLSTMGKAEKTERGNDRPLRSEITFREAAMTNNWFFPSCQPDVHAVKRALMRKEADERDEREDYRMAAATSFPEWAYVGCKSLITSTNTGLRKAMQITTFRACYTVLHFKLELL